MTRSAEASRGRIAPARVAAFETLRAVNTDAADLPHALARARTKLHDERDRALAGEVATGAIRWQAAFDHIIAAIGKRSIAKFDAEVVDILRTAIFQLLHLDRVPASAVVNDAVSLTRLAGKRSAAPLVNAILRRISRERGHLPLPERPQHVDDRDRALDYLSITLSHPRWLAARWLDRYGFAAAESWMQFNNQPARLTLRVNTLATTTAAAIALLNEHGVRVEPARFVESGLTVLDGNPLLTPAAKDGLFFVQDEASQVVGSLVAARAGQRVLDACASPGGKTIAIAGAMQDRGLVVAMDVRERRIDLLRRTVRASGARSVRIVHGDATAAPFGDSSGASRGRPFDWVLLDAPCSGLGTVRRDPDVKWKRRETDLAGLAAAQLRMLREAARVVRPEGRLIYSTCSSEPEENEGVVRAFLADGGFTPARPDVTERASTLVNAEGHLRTFPFRDRLEAFFAAAFVKHGW
jgi:16S rRNA (cytosine967-C5)-methyltransferase